MRLAVFSDIHGNIGAFEAVLRDMDALGIRDAVSLGDNVGYGPDPGPVLRLLKARGIASVLGNHEAALADRRRRCNFNSQSRAALDLTEGWLDAEGRALIAAMPSVLVREGCRFVHGMPPDSPFKYLFEFMGRGMPKVFRLFEEMLCFVGHTHEIEVLRCGAEGSVASVLLPSPVHDGAASSIAGGALGPATPVVPDDAAGRHARGAPDASCVSSGCTTGADGGPRPSGIAPAPADGLTGACRKSGVGAAASQTLPLDAGARYLINVGSVGQPRDGDPRAKYVVWDDTARLLVVRRVPYDVAAAVRRFGEAGVARRYIDRLL